MPSALITGSTDGIGLALAGVLRSLGWRVFTHGRREGSDPDYCRADLADPASAVHAVAAFLEARGNVGLDLVIHNAAVGYIGAFANQPVQEMRDLIAINLQSPIALSRALAGRVAAAGGKIVFIGSVVTPLPCPDFALYSATKAALAGFVRSVRAEGDLRVQIVHPGATRTGMHAKSGQPPDRLEKFSSPEDVAQAVARAVIGSDADRVIGIANRSVFAAGHLARPALARLARKARPIPGACVPRHYAITGGARGIGAALAERLRRAGHTTTTIDRVAPSDASGIEADLLTGEGITSALDGLAARAPIDVFVHNAGINAVGSFKGSDPARAAAVVDLNFLAPVLLTAGLLERGLLADGATLVSIASLSCHLGYPGAAAYAASKDGLASLAASLHAAGPDGLRTLTVFPGPTRTEHAAEHSPDNSRAERRMPPEVLADKIADAVSKGRTTLVPGLLNRTLALAGTAFPATTSRLMRRAILGI